MHQHLKNYSREVKVPLEDLVFNAGEEFIHLFTIDPKDYDTAKKLIRENDGQIFLKGDIRLDFGLIHQH